MGNTSSSANAPIKNPLPGLFGNNSSQIMPIKNSNVVGYIKYMGDSPLEFTSTGQVTTLTISESDVHAISNFNWVPGFPFVIPLPISNGKTLWTDGYLGETPGTFYLMNLSPIHTYYLIPNTPVPIYSNV